MTVNLQTRTQACYNKLVYSKGRSSLKQRSFVVRSILKLESKAEKEHIFNLPVFESRRMLHPTDEGQLLAYEDKYLQLFDEANKKLSKKADKDKHKSKPQLEQEALFLHIMSPKHCPPAFLEDSVGGLPRIGVCCQITSIERDSDQNLQVDYEAKRRVNLIGVLPPEGVRLYKEALVEWYDDEQVEEDLVANLEQELYQCLVQVSKISKKLNKGDVKLPHKFGKYSPPPSALKRESLKSQNMVAAVNIETWQRQKPSYQKQKINVQDPYQIVRANVNRQMRRELFSFVCASLLEVGPIERIALAQSRDTAERMGWILKAVRPYLQQLRTQYQLQRTIEK